MALTTAVDTYCTLEEANAYFGDRLASTAWIDAMDLDREAALRMAFTALERLYWVGSQTRRPWSSGTAYTPGDDVVVRAANGTAAWYRCKVGHTATAADKPGAGAGWETYWTRLPSHSQWPRDGVHDANGDPFDPDLLPQWLKDAQCEEALALLKDAGDDSTETRRRLQQQGVVSVRMGDVQEQYGRPGSVAGLSSRTAFSLVRRYLLRSPARVVTS